MSEKIQNNHLDTIDGVFFGTMTIVAASLLPNLVVPEGISELEDIIVLIIAQLVVAGIPVSLVIAILMKHLRTLGIRKIDE